MPMVTLFGNLRRLAGETQLRLAGETVGAVLEMLCARHPPLRAAIFDGAALRPHVRVIVNGRDSELLQGLSTPLTDDDQVAIFPPIAGGRVSPVSGGRNSL